MKKIGILTFQDTLNYGAQLQNFALQEYLKKILKKCEIYVINYKNEQIDSIEKKINLYDQKKIKDFIKFVKNGKSKKKKWAEFEKFREKYINLTQTYTINNIKNIENKMDYFVAGSDQIWNTDITGNDYTYFLDFVQDKEKKHSYAASIGKLHYSNEQKDKIYKLLKNFKNITVRENSANKELTFIGIKDVNTVMDPTFLLSKEEWIKNLNLKKNKSEYIFVYMIDEVSRNFKKIKRFADKNKLDIIYINNNFFNIRKVVNDRKASPIDFLNYIYNAKYIITGSFHAICFSLIFNKDFYYIYNKKNGRNSRIEDLMKLLKISDDSNITDTENINKVNIEYSTVVKLMNEEINSSKNIIKDITKNWSE